MSNAIATIPQSLTPLSSFRDKIDVIKDTVARGASDAQLEMFLHICDRYQLDPFLKEIWFVPSVGVMTGRDGYLKVAIRDADYDGIVSGAVFEGDHFEIDPIAPTVKHTFGAKRGEIIGAYAIVYHKHRRPAVTFASYSEYKKSGNVWSTYKSAMICKVAEVLALKRQFGISGLVTEEEIGHQVAPSPTGSKPAKGERHNDAQKRVVEQKLSPTSEEQTPTLDAAAEESPLDKPWRTKKEMLHVFEEIASECLDAGVPQIYSETLADSEVVGPADFTDGEKAFQCYMEIYSRLSEAKAAQR